MDDKQLFQSGLGLKAQWFVSDVKLNKAKKKLDICTDCEGNDLKTLVEPKVIDHCALKDDR